jgi:hypothetical protein
MVLMSSSYAHSAQPISQPHSGPPTPMSGHAMGGRRTRNRYGGRRTRNRYGGRRNSNRYGGSRGRKSRQRFYF